MSAPISSAALLEQADREMYRAKRSGRAQICHPPIELTMVSHQERSALMNLQIEESPDAR
jgi:hypothetical protein